MFGMQVQSQGEEGGYENLLYLKGGGMKKYFERMRGHEKFTMSLQISSGPTTGINNDCSLTKFARLSFLSNGKSC
jgi:hypothetical protein